MTQPSPPIPSSFPWAITYLDPRDNQWYCLVTDETRPDFHYVYRYCLVTDETRPNFRYVYRFDAASGTDGKPAIWSTGVLASGRQVLEARKAAREQVDKDRRTRSREIIDWRIQNRAAVEKHLFKAVKERYEELDDLLYDLESDEWKGQDGFYRFYHNSYKVVLLKNHTKHIVATLRSLVPEGTPLNPMFEEILEQGAGESVKFNAEWNTDWLAHTRGIVEAYMHAREFLTLAAQYGRYFVEEEDPEDRVPPTMLPTGWAALLYLFNLR